MVFSKKRVEQAYRVVPFISRKGAKGACALLMVRLMPWHNYAR
jgi:hypothetical protein